MALLPEMFYESYATYGEQAKNAGDPIACYDCMIQ